jgi:hypothetical protein
LDNAPYTSLKETKLKPSYHENSPQKNKLTKIRRQTETRKNYYLQTPVQNDASKRHKQTFAVLFEIVRISSAFQQ